MLKFLRLAKIRRMVNSLQTVKIRRMLKSLRPAKIMRMVKSLRLLKSLRLVKYQQEKLVARWRTPYCLGSAESPTADFSLVPLMSMFSSSLMCSPTCSLQVRNGSPVPSFYGRTLSRTVPAACTGPPCSEMVQIHAAIKSKAFAWNSTNFSQITAVSNSAYRCSITELKKCK